MPRRPLLVLAALLLVAAALALVLGAALREGRGPVRCPPGLIALGARCCGAGQSLRDERCAGPPATCGAEHDITPEGCVARPRRIALGGGTLRLVPGDWEARAGGTAREVFLAPFLLDAHEATEARYAACLREGRCPARPLTGEPGRPMTSVTLDEARALCRFEGGDVPTSDQLAFAAAGSGGRRYPWGETGAVCRRAAFGLAAGPCAQGGRGPDLAGARPDGASPEGVHDLGGNVAEWARLTAAGSDAEGEARGGGATAAEVRGGSWSDHAAGRLRSWHATRVDAATRSPSIGLRCAYPP